MKQQPNFLVICMDQIHAASLGCNGNKMAKTPNMDRLARSGINFARPYCSNPVCMPNRASFITGLTPRQHGLLTNGTFLPDNVPTITQALVDNGYRTHSVGKLHLQPVGEDGDRKSWESRKRWNRGEIKSLPSPYYGFQSADLTVGHVSGVSGDYANWLDDCHPGARAKLQRESAYFSHGQAFRLNIPAELHYNHWIGDRTIEFLEKEGDARPFYLFCSFPDPHSPFAACKPYSEMVDPRDVDIPSTYGCGEDLIPFLAEYRHHAVINQAPAESELREIIAQTYGMIAHVDDNVGRILESVKKLGLNEDTIVVLTADHGEYLGANDLLFKGVFPLEELWRVPLVWRVPGVSPSRCDTPVSTLDFVPTVCDLVGMDRTLFTSRGPCKSAPLPLPGRSLAPLFSGEALSPTPVLLEYDEDWHAGPLIRMRGLVDGFMKLVVYLGSEEGILVDLENDPLERTNLWNHPDYREIRQRMMAQLSQKLIATERFDTRRVCGA